MWRRCDETADCAIVVGRELYALQLCRFLARGGWRVVLASSQSSDFAGSSRFVSAVVRVPRPETHYSAWALQLQIAVARFGARLIVPAAEETFYCEKAHGLIEAATSCRVFTHGSLELLETLHNKWRFFQLMRQLLASSAVEEQKIVQLPDTHHIESVADFKALQRKSSVIIKPCFSRGGVSALLAAPDAAPRARGAKQDTSDDWSLLESFLLQHGPCVVQEYILGENLSTLAIAIEGEIVATCCYKVLFTSEESGFGPVRQSCEVKAVTDFVHAIVGHTRFTGLIGFDFMESASSGAIFPLECNPRATNGLSFLQHDFLAIAAFRAGVDTFLRKGGDACMPGQPHPAEVAPLSPYLLPAGALACNLVVVATQLRLKGLQLLETVMRCRGDDVLDLRDPLPFCHAWISALKLAAAVGWSRLPSIKCLLRRRLMLETLAPRDAATFTSPRSFKAALARAIEQRVVQYPPAAAVVQGAAFRLPGLPGGATWALYPLSLLPALRSHDGQYLQRFCAGFLKAEEARGTAETSACVSDCIANASGKVEVFIAKRGQTPSPQSSCSGEVALPVILADAPTETKQLKDMSYTCSLYAHYVLYARSEINAKCRGVAWVLAQVVLAGLGRLFAWCDIDRLAFVNNWYLSTNLHPSYGDTAEQVEGVCMTAVSTVLAHHPDRAIAFRSLDMKQSPEVIAALQKLGSTLCFARNIHYQDVRQKGLWTKRSLESDMRLFAELVQDEGSTASQTAPDSTKLYVLQRWEAGLEMSLDLAERLVQLYRMLYIDKYSPHNPQFTPRFVQHLAKHGLLTFLLVLTNDRSSRVDGVIGYFRRGEVMTTPFFGYDTTLPQELGLYRILSLLVAREGRSLNLMVNASGGVGDFKRKRGAVTVPEYTAVFDRHLIFRRRLPYTIIGWLTRVLVVPFLEAHRGEGGL